MNTGSERTNNFLLLTHTKITSSGSSPGPPPLSSSDVSPRRNKEKFYLFGFVVQNSHAARAGTQQQCIIHNDICSDADTKTLGDGLRLGVSILLKYSDCF